MNVTPVSTVWTSSSVVFFVFIENFIQHTFSSKRQYTGIVVVHCCYTEDFKSGKDQIKVWFCRLSYFFFCTALLNKTETNEVSSEKKKIYISKCNRRKSSMVHQERKKRENPTHKKYGHLAPSVPTKARFLDFFFLFLFFLHVHIFKYTILKCLYRASYALTRGAFHLCLKGERKGCRYGR